MPNRRPSPRTHPCVSSSCLRVDPGAAPRAAASLCSAGPSPSIVEYVIPRPGNFPHDPAVAKDGTIWYTDQRNSYIGHLDPETGKIVDYPTPTPGSGPHGLIVAPDGQIWYTGQGAGVLGRVDPKTGHITEFALPGNARNPHTPIYHGQGLVHRREQQHLRQP